MLSPDDADLVARDAALPALGVLLDDEAMRERLAGLAGSEVRGATARYVRYKPGTSCLVAYEIATGNGPGLVHARTLVSPAKLRKVCEGTWVTGPLGLGVRVDDDLALFEFPNDGALPALHHLAGDDERSALWGRILDTDPREATDRVLRYKPQRRCTLRVNFEDGASAVVKLYRRPGFEEARRHAKAFASEGPLVVPRRTGRSNRRAALAFEWLEGEPLSTRPPHEWPPGLPARVAAALAMLHRQAAPRDARSRTPAGWLERASFATEAVAPSLLPRVRRASQIVLDDMDRTTAPAPTASVHGDLSADQVILMEDGRIGLIDLDRAGRGDPRLDIARFVATLLAIDGVELEPALGIGREMLDAYREAGGAELRPGFSRFIAAELLRLAPEAFRLRRTGWRERAERAVHAAEEIMRRDAAAV